MARCWLESDVHGRRPVGGLTDLERSHALAFARLAKDIYPDQTNKDRGQASLVMNWLELLQTSRDRARGTNLVDVQTFIYRCFGFNAALYSLRHSGKRCWVLSFEGSDSLLSLRGLPDWVLTNLPTVLSAANGLEAWVPGQLFTRHLNPTKAPATQYEVADLVTRCVIQSKGKAELVLTGHSLVGGLAQYAAAQNGLRAIVFNSAGIGFRIPGGADGRAFDSAICHLMTTTDGALLRNLGHAAQGRLFQVMGAAIAMSQPMFQREAMNVFNVGTQLASQSQPTFAAMRSLIDQEMNRAVTTYTRGGSKQVGTRYVVGYGGHGIDAVIDCLARPQMLP